MPGLSGVHRMGRQSPGATVEKAPQEGSILRRGVSSGLGNAPQCTGMPVEWSRQCPTMHWDASGVVHQHPSYLEKHQIMKDLVWSR